MITDSGKINDPLWSKQPHVPHLPQCKQSTVNILKIWTPEKNAVIILKFEQYCFTTEYWVQKMLTE